MEEYEAEDGSKHTYDYFYGLIGDSQSNQAIYFEQDNICMDSTPGNYSINFEEEHEMGLSMMESVEFK